MITVFSSNLPGTLALGMPVGWEWLIIAGFGLLLFGKRLPEVGRSLGKGIIEFKKGLKGIGDDIDEQSSKPSLPPAESRKQIATPGDQSAEV